LISTLLSQYQFHNMRIASTSKTPYIFFDFDQETLEIKGVSCPENPKEFYEPLFQKLTEFTQNHSKLDISISLDYFNTGSSKTLWMLFNELAKNEKLNAQTSVKWLTDKNDDELKEAGVIFQEMSGLKFEFIDVE
jgi:hypothetical protein